MGKEHGQRSLSQSFTALQSDLTGMTELDEYMVWARSLNQYKSEDPTATLLWMGNEISSEVGELTEIFAKRTRKFGEIDIEDETVLNCVEEELGDILFWVASIAQRLDLSLDLIIMNNIRKLTQRLADEQNTQKD